MLEAAFRKIYYRKFQYRLGKLRGESLIREAMFTKYLSQRFCRCKATNIRLLGASIGLLSLLLPWGSIQVWNSKAHFISNSIGQSSIDLLQNGDPMVVFGMAMFIMSTILAVIDERAVIGQIFGVVVLFGTIPSYLLAIAPQMVVLTEGEEFQAVLAFGIYVGILSIAILVLTYFSNWRDPTFWRHDELEP